MNYVQNKQNYYSGQQTRLSTGMQLIWPEYAIETKGG